MNDAREQPGSITALDRYWETRPHGGTTTADVLDPIATAVERFHALTDVPGPDSAFVAALQWRLLHTIPAAAATSPVSASPVDPVIATAPPPLVSEREGGGPRGNRGPSPFRRGAEVVAVAALLTVVLGGTLMVLRHTPPGSQDRIAPAPMAAVAFGPTAPGLGWTARVDDAGGAFVHGPVVADDLAFVTGYALDHAAETVGGESLIAFDLRSGAERWRARAPDLGGHQFTAPTAAGGAIFVGLSPPIAAPNQADQTLLALDAATGAERWRLAVPLMSWAPPLVAADTLYAGSEDEAITAVDAATGALRWRRSALPEADPERQPRGRPLAIAGGTLFLSGNGFLLGLDAASGAERWRLDLPIDAWTPIVAGRDGAYLSVGLDPAGRWDGTRILALAPDGGTQWQVDIPGIHGTPLDLVLGDDVLVLRAPTDDPVLVALDLAAGTERWRTTFDGYLPGPPTVADGVVYVGNEIPGLFDLDFAVLGATDYLHAVAAATGRRLWRLEPDFAGSSISDIASDSGLVLFHGYDDYDSDARGGTLYAYDLTLGQTP